MIDETLGDISHGQVPNQPGIQWVKAIPAHAFLEGLPDNLSRIIALERDAENSFPIEGLQTLPSFNWLNIANDFPLPFELQIVPKETPQGPYSQYTISQEVPHNDYLKVAKHIRSYQRREWILAIKLMSGELLFLHNFNGKGAKFSSKYKSGNQLKGPAQHILEFQYDSYERVMSLLDLSPFKVELKSIELLACPSDFEIKFAWEGLDYLASVFGLSFPPIGFSFQAFIDGDWQNIHYEDISDIALDTSVTISSTITPLPNGIYWSRIIIGDFLISNQVKLIVDC